LIASGIFEATKGDDNNYFWFFIFFGSLGVIGTILAFVIFIYDKKHGNILDTKESDDPVIKDKVKRSKRSTFIK
jgi:predicted membrane protein